MALLLNNASLHICLVNAPVMNPTSLPNLTEEKMVEALRSSSQQSFEILYNRFAGVLYGTICGWIRDGHTAENLLQDAFVKAWINRQTYDPAKGRVFTWLYNITRNVCIDHYRSRQYKQGQAADLSDDFSRLLHHQPDRPPDAIDLKNLLNHLRNEEKEVVELMYFKGFTQKEIASLMNMPLGTVKTRVGMAIKNLRALFLRDWAEAQEKISFYN